MLQMCAACVCVCVCVVRAYVCACARERYRPKEEKKPDSGSVVQNVVQVSHLVIASFSTGLLPPCFCVRFSWQFGGAINALIEKNTLPC